MEKNKRVKLIILLGLLSAIGPFSIDMYLPAFPVVAADLNTSVDTLSYSLSSFFIGICIGQILCGPLLDRFGRKRPLYGGLVLYILASIGCAVATSIEVLVLFRFLQALGGCLGMVAPRAIVRDVFPVEENAKVFSLLILVLGVSPIIAPTVGSLIIANYDWHTVFVVLALVTTLLLAAVYFFLPESKAPDPNFSLHPRPILQAFRSVLTVPQFYTYAPAGGLVSSAVFAYLSGSPFVFMNLYGLTEQQYGWIFGLIAAGLIATSQLNNVLLKRFKSEQIIRITIPLQALIGLTMVIGTVTHSFGLIGIIACIALFLSCQGFSFPNASALAMAPFSKGAGSASALFGGLQMGLGALASALVGIFNNGTAVPLAAVMTGCAILAWLILTFGRKRIAYQCRQTDVNEQTLEMIETY
jgi:MFS transporter, DHA1 family, multidrug resistance protein